MTIKEIKALLPKISVPKSSYNIDNSPTPIVPGTIILERIPKGFSVYWTERNEVFEQRDIADEEEAVNYFLHLLEGSSKTHRKYIVNHVV
ncbi:hypothetical protein [Veillonella montpellierensis]|uniref:hypothetical protein n=1 Tax=Veillonella montpellierensis TaxID=187328 RepID=UPI0003FB48C8|nr:hypothetical protein [Veillonella montpellierensis]